MRKFALAIVSLILALTPVAAADFVTIKSKDIMIVPPPGSRTPTLKTADNQEYRIGYGVNRNTWKIELLLVRVRGFLGIGSVCVAIPIAHAKLEDQAATIDLTAGELERAPRYVNSIC